MRPSDFARKLVAIGLEPRVIEASRSSGREPGYCVTASHGEGERALYFHGHYDVVPHSVEGQFDPVIRHSNLFGRGSSDSEERASRHDLWRYRKRCRRAKIFVSMDASN